MRTFHGTFTPDIVGKTYRDYHCTNLHRSLIPVDKEPELRVISSRNAVAAASGKLSTVKSLSLSLSLSLLSVRPSGSLINGHDERDFEDKKVSHMKQKRRIIAANDNVQKETEGSLSVRWREEKEEELKLSQEN